MSDVGLAVSDLASLLALIMVNIWLTPAVSTADFSFEVIGVYYLTAGIPYLTITRVTSWITAIITLERALCVIALLQVIVCPDYLLLGIFYVYRSGRLIVYIILIVSVNLSVCLKV